MSNRPERGAVNSARAGGTELSGKGRRRFIIQRGTWAGVVVVGDARADVFDYIERFYNPKRRHSTIGYFQWNSSGISLTGCHPNRVQA